MPALSLRGVLIEFQLNVFSFIKHINNEHEYTKNKTTKSSIRIQKTHRETRNS